MFINIIKNKAILRLSLRKCMHECRAGGQQAVSIRSLRQKTLGFSASLRLDQAVFIVRFSAICSFKADEIHLHSFISFSVGLFLLFWVLPQSLCIAFVSSLQISSSVTDYSLCPYTPPSSTHLFICCSVPPVLPDLKRISTQSRSGFIWANLSIFFSSSIFPGNCLSIDNTAAWQGLLWPQVTWAEHVIMKGDWMITHSWLHHQGHQSEDLQGWDQGAGTFLFRKLPALNISPEGAAGCFTLLERKGKQ